jgi:hypothetical protein
MRTGSPARPLACGHSATPPAGDRQDNHQGARDRQVPDPTLSRTCSRKRQRRAHGREQHRQAVHTEEARQLRDGQDRHLAVTEQHPRKAGDVGSPQLRRHPHDRRRQQRNSSVRHHDAPHEQREERREQCEVRDQRAVDQNGDPRLQASVYGHHTRDPVERAGEVDDAGDEAEQKGAAKGCALEGDEQWRQRDPAERRVAELGETENEQRARHHGERNIHAARQQDVRVTETCADVVLRVLARVTPGLSTALPSEVCWRRCFRPRPRA